MTRPFRPPARPLATDPGPLLDPGPAPPIYRQLTDERLHDPRQPDIEEPTVSEHRYRDDPIPASRAVFDPDLGADGGGRHADPLPAFDAYDVEHLAVEDERPPGAAWDTAERISVLRTHSELDAHTVVPCPACGTGVHPSRITG